MNDNTTDVLQINWQQAQGKLKSKWSKLTDADISSIHGSSANLVARLKDRYQYSDERALTECKTFCTDLQSKSGVPYAQGVAAGDSSRPIPFASKPGVVKTDAARPASNVAPISSTNTAKSGNPSSSVRPGVSGTQGGGTQGGGTHGGSSPSGQFGNKRMGDSSPKIGNKPSDDKTCDSGGKGSGDKEGCNT